MKPIAIELINQHYHDTEENASIETLEKQIKQIILTELQKK